MNIHYNIMKEVISAAKTTLETGESPFAAAIVIDGRIEVMATNQTKKIGNPLIHAEIAAINEFITKRPAKDLCAASIYCSCEPCVLCFSAIQLVGIKQIVYAASIQDAIKFDSGDIAVSIKSLAKEWNVEIEINPDILRQEATALFEDYTHRYGSL